MPKIELNIEYKKYVALIDTGASLSLINSEIHDFKKIKLSRPITFSTITNKDTINYEVHTKGPDEFNLPNNARVRWKVTPFIGRLYDFIIGTDTLNGMKSNPNKIKVKEKQVRVLNSVKPDYIIP